MASQAVHFWIIGGAEVPPSVSSCCQVLISLDSDKPSDPLNPFSHSVIVLRADLDDFCGPSRGPRGLIVNKDPSGPVQSVWTGIYMYIFVPNEDEVAHPKWGPGHLTSASGAWCGWGEGQLEDEIDRGVWGCVELSNEEMDWLL